MIQKIKICNCATYCDDGATINDLRKVNFIYGANGSGKTTISRVISQPTNYEHCTVEWENDRVLERLVYNQDFVSKNFLQTDHLKGIFTLGENNLELEKEIEELSKRNEELVVELDKKKELRATKSSEIAENFKAFRDACWNVKSEIDTDLGSCLVGFRGDKTKFTQKCIDEQHAETITKDYESLKNEIKELFVESTESIPEITYIRNETEQFKSSELLSTCIVGKENVSISGLIGKLNNSDWVRTGAKYLDIDSDNCPFCQQSLPKDFASELEEYFDEQYKILLSKLEKERMVYHTNVQSMLEKLHSLVKIESEYMDNELILEKTKLIQVLVEENISVYEQKLREPSNRFELKEVSAHIQEVNQIISLANSKIKERNQRISNLKIARESLIKDTWKFVASRVKASYQIYDKKNKALNGAVEGITKKLIDLDQEHKNNKTLIQDKERSITSIRPTVDNINKLLESFGFNNFKMAVSDKKTGYKLVRANGEDAKGTLSEGEKTFVTFLYFYHLLKGSLSSGNIMIPKIVVLDDPISSLDSDILFIVSNLIRTIIEDMREDYSNIKQVFVLTHNIYFHKEVSFNKGKGNNRLKDETFYILRKKSGKSCVTTYESNPIKTSYELLWSELRNREFASAVSLQNIIRRIIENYFKIIGNIHEDTIINAFEGKKKVICRSLLSWINDGSHYVSDDLYIDTSEDMIDKYLEVFKEIFEKTNHIQHYNMMMQIE